MAKFKPDKEVQERMDKDPEFKRFVESRVCGQGLDWQNDETFKNIDPGIRETVKLLVANGITTFSSCQGGEGHVHSFPTITLKLNENPSCKTLYQLRIKIATLLKHTGYKLFTISEQYPYGKNGDVVGKNGIVQGEIKIVFTDREFLVKIGHIW